MILCTGKAFRIGEIVDLAVERDLIKKSGSWFSYGGEKIGQGRDNAKKFVEENPDILELLETQIRQDLGMPTGDEIKQAAQPTEEDTEE